MKEQFCLCVDGVYVQSGKIFLVKRNTVPFKDYWHLIGGHVEEDETPKQALKREFKEETNLDVQIGDIIDYRIEKTFDRTKIILIYEIVDAQGKIELNSENKEYGWFAQLPDKIVFDYTKYLCASS